MYNRQKCQKTHAQHVEHPTKSVVLHVFKSYADINVRIVALIIIINNHHKQSSSSKSSSKFKIIT